MSNIIIVDTGSLGAPGLYSMTTDQYHADPCPKPSLSHSLAKLVIRRTPYHAMKHHPKMGGMPNSPTRPMMVGTAAHTLVLGKGSRLQVIDAPDYRTKAAQQLRDAALADGATPVLEADYALAQEMVPAGRLALEEALGAKLDDCLIEVVVAVQDAQTGCWRRIMVDAMTPDLRNMADYKTCEDANPVVFERAVRNYGYDTQDAFYKRVVDRIEPEGEGKRTYTLVAQERDYPECVTFHRVDGDLHAVAENRIKMAEAKWDACLLADTWEAYSREVHMIAARDWEIQEAMVEGADV